MYFYLENDKMYHLVKIVIAVVFVWGIQINLTYASHLLHTNHTLQHDINPGTINSCHHKMKLKKLT